ncbi:MAG: VWA domain-containing protein [Chloroflexota bacterium]
MKNLPRFILTLRLRSALALGLLLSILLFPASPALAQDSGPQIRITQVDNSQFPQVTVYISVTNAAGEPVAIDPASLQVFENGALMQPVATTGQGEITTLTTLLIVDVSGSMEKSHKMDGAKDAAKAYVNQMRAGDQAGLISFDTEVHIVQEITADKAALIAAIDSLQPSGNTAMFDALLKGVETLSGVEGRKTIILLSDGLDNRSQATVEEVITAIGPAGLSISTIGLGDPAQAGNNYGLDEPALKGLAERAGGLYGFATAPDELLALYEQRGRALQGEYSFTYISPSALRDGVNRQLSVSINELSAVGQYNPGGVLPEVASSSLPLFGAILLGLLALLALPFILKGIGGLFSGRRKKSKVRFSEPAVAAKGRVRLK